MFIVSFFQLKYKLHEGIVFWGSVLVTEVSPVPTNTMWSTVNYQYIFES